MLSLINWLNAAKDKAQQTHALGKGFGYIQMFMVKASTDLAADMGPTTTFPSCLEHGQSSSRSSGRHTPSRRMGWSRTCTAAPVEIPTAWPAWAAAALVNYITLRGVNLKYCSLLKFCIVPASQYSVKSMKHMWFRRISSVPRLNVLCLFLQEAVPLPCWHHCISYAPIKVKSTSNFLRK